ncbi:MAG TPA: plastocyanin/azurin family copper-binding protein [Gemmatimonadaceae bacterium]
MLALIAGCGGDQKPAANDAQPSAPSASTSAGPLTPAPGGKVIEVDMVTDGEGSYFKPAEVHANKGDVVRFTLKVGVHNVHFLADSNAGKSGYPSAPSEFLQLPAQTFDVATSMEPGSYYFQCDPHAALGMKGKLIVH